MCTYIQKDIEGYVVESDGISLPMGYSYEDFENGKYIGITEAQANYIKDHPMATPKELINIREYDGKNVEYYAAVSEPTVDMVRNRKLSEIMEFDSSSSVNEFILNGEPMWASKEERRTIRERIALDESLGLDNTRIHIGGKQYELPISYAKELLLKIEVYSRDVHDRTAEHIAAVGALKSSSAIDEYDHTTGYPTKLSLSI